MPDQPPFDTPDSPDVMCTPAQLEQAKRVFAASQADSQDEEIGGPAEIQLPPDARTFQDAGPDSVTCYATAASMAASDVTDTQKQGKKQDTDDQNAQIDTGQGTGDVTTEPRVESPAAFDFSRATADQARKHVWGRFASEGRDLASLGLERDEMMKLSKRIKDRDERFRWVYSELDRLYPPLESGDPEIKNKDLRQEPSLSPNDLRQKRKFSAVQEYSTDSGQIQGLGNIPQDWPELQSNASLSAEIGWVQANRLRVVEERPGAATLVRLERAGSPAPSWAALGWLETSIRSYAKFVDVAARASGGDDDEGAVMRRERMAIEEVEGLINDMMEAEGGQVCRRCGQRIGSRPEIEPDPPGGATESR